MRVIDETKLNDTLQFIRDYQTKEGKTPTYRVIQSKCHFSSLASVSLYVETLKKRGLIETDNNGSLEVVRIFGTKDCRCASSNGN